MTESVAEDDQSDLIALPHPLLGPLLSTAGSPFRFLRIQRYIEGNIVASPTQPTLDPSAIESALRTDAELSKSAVQMVAKLRNGKPLIVDRQYGEGRVMTVLTSLLPTWNTWAKDPTFVVFALRSVGYLGSFRRAEVGVPSGTPWSDELSLQKYLPEVEFLIPAGTAGTRLPMKSVAVAQSGSQDGANESKGITTLSVFANDLSEEMIHQLLEPGIVESWRTDFAGNREVQNRAFYALPAEGDLRKSSPSELIAALRPVPTKHRYAENMTNSVLAAGLVNRDTLLMSLLIALLLIEQALAYATSFHPPLRKGGLR